MSIQGMMRNQAKVHRLTETENEFFEKINTFTLSDTIRIAITPPDLRRTDLGPGDIARGILEGYAESDADIQEEDILDVIAGPQAPARLRVLTKKQADVSNRRHHVELTMEPSTQALPGDA